MVNPTNRRPRRYVPRTGRDVWTPAEPLGYLESIQAAGSVAAPLLAAASFTLVALVLQSSTPFGRWENLALLLFVAAGLAQVFAVQSVIWTRRYMATPDEFKEWFPDDFANGGERPTQWLADLQEFYDQTAEKWAERTRLWINVGISLLLAGIAVGVVPPMHISSWRWAVITVAWVGVAVEVSWVTAAMVGEPARRGLLLRLAALYTSGGATAAAGFAATADTPHGGSATGWAIALAILAVPIWLAAATDARLSHGRVRAGSPVSGLRSFVWAAAAVLAPAVFFLALGSAIRKLAQSRRAKLAGQHPGVAELLPKDVRLGAHHRAWSRCTASAVTESAELAELLDESAQRLGPLRQPSLPQLRKQLARSPGCVVEVVDADDERKRFGYYIVYPLLADAVGHLKSGQITDGHQLEPLDLAEPTETAEGWYVSVIWAQGPEWTRRGVIASLVDALAASGAGTKGRPVFASPATDQGRMLMRRYGFVPVGASADDIWICGE